MGNTRPAGGRPPGRRGRGGIGPGPGYRAPGKGKGTKHKSSPSAALSVMVLLYTLYFGIPAVVVGGIVLFMLHGYGVLG